MADNQGPSSAAVLLGFLSGAALGAVTARRAEDGLRDLVGEAGERFEGAVEEGRDFIESKKTVLRDAFDAGREAMRREREHFTKGEQS